MKVCKKCKRQVTNKTKICKHCGADVSKCKIISNKPKNNNQKNTQTIKKEEANNKKNQIKTNQTIKESKQIKINITNKEPKDKELEKTKIYKLPTNTYKTPKENQTKLKKIINLLQNSIKNKKNITIITIILLLLSTAYITYAHYYKDDSKVIIGEKATNKKLFNMNEIINYKGVNYQVVKVETSTGNNYKRPKEGNIFLIVTIKIENNTTKKINYSYKNWTMSNSTQEEEKRIFTSINVGTALYSGKLVIGGIKTGSMVFEQPKNEDKLKLNYYELKTEKGEEDIDKEKKVFSVSIKLPEEQEKRTNQKKEQTIKTMAKAKNTKNLEKKS